MKIHVSLLLQSERQYTEKWKPPFLAGTKLRVVNCIDGCWSGLVSGLLLTLYQRKKKILHILQTLQQGKIWNSRISQYLFSCPVTGFYFLQSDSFQHFLYASDSFIFILNQKCCCRWWFDVANNSREIHGVQPSCAVFFLNTGPVPCF